MTSANDTAYYYERFQPWLICFSEGNTVDSIENVKSEPEPDFEGSPPSTPRRASKQVESWEFDIYIEVALSRVCHRMAAEFGQNCTQKRLFTQPSSVEAGPSHSTVLVGFSYDSTRPQNTTTAIQLQEKNFTQKDYEALKNILTQRKVSLVYVQNLLINKCENLGFKSECCVLQKVK
jgi:hypothetical protein